LPPEPACAPELGFALEAVWPEAAWLRGVPPLLATGVPDGLPLLDLPLLDGAGVPAVAPLLGAAALPEPLLGADV
jgi:hypothetical protein